MANTTIDAICYDVYPCDYEHVCDELLAMVGRDVVAYVEHQSDPGREILRTSGILRSPRGEPRSDDLRLRFPVGDGDSTWIEISPADYVDGELAGGYVRIKLGALQLTVERRHFPPRRSE